MPGISSRPALTALLVLALVSAVLAAGPPAGADQYDTTRPALDLNDLYVFRSPTNASNTVLIMTAGPRAGVDSPLTFARGVGYELRIDHDGDAEEDLTYRLTFGKPRPQGQPFTLERKIAPAKQWTRLGGGLTGQNVPVAGGGMVRAGLQDDPTFYDRAGLVPFLDGSGAFPRPVGLAANFFGPNANTLAVVLEVPSASISEQAGAVIGVWARLSKGKKQIDRVGRPLTGLLLLTGDDRRALNAGHPARDRDDVKPSVVARLQSFYGRSSADSNAIADLWLPDVLLFQLGNPNGFGTFISGPNISGTQLGNGRRLRDDVLDVLLTSFTDGATTTDNVPDDNGTRITDGSGGTTAAFPYIGPANP